MNSCGFVPIANSLDRPASFCSLCSVAVQQIRRIWSYNAPMKLGQDNSLLRRFWELICIRRSLGNIILSQEGEMLKLLAGSIIREMLHHKVPEDKFWPILETPDVIVNSFPRAADHTSQWVWNFHSYLEKDVLHDAVDDR